MPPQENHALIFGASGVSGWALAKECLTYPTATTFARVTALTNRPISHAETHLPQDPRLNLASGVDLTKPVSEVQDLLVQKVPDVKIVTHVFFTAYIEKPDYAALRSVNTQLVETAATALDNLCGATTLQHIILQTGGKHYGVEFTKQGDNIFYYAQYDAVAALAGGKQWTFTEVRPDVIVGFTPGTNFMNAAQGLGFYLTLWRAVYGRDAEVPFMGTEASWRNRHTDTSQDVLARFEIHAAMNGGTCGGGKSFNSSDGPVVTWAEKWPGICAYFGLKGVAPVEEKGSGKVGAVKAFAEQHAGKWKEVEEKEGLKKGIFEKYSWGFIDGVCIMFDFDRQYDMSAAREVGFKEEVDTVKDGFSLAFDRMKEAKIIP